MCSKPRNSRREWERFEINCIDMLLPLGDDIFRYLCGAQFPRATQLSRGGRQSSIERLMEAIHKFFMHSFLIHLSIEKYELKVNLSCNYKSILLLHMKISKYNK